MAGKEMAWGERPDWKYHGLDPELSPAESLWAAAEYGLMVPPRLYMEGLAAGGKGLSRLAGRIPGERAAKLAAKHPDYQAPGAWNIEKK